MFSFRDIEASEGVKFRVRCFLDRDQPIIRVGEVVQNFVKFALDGGLLPGLGVLDHEDHEQGDGGAGDIENVVPPVREPGGEAEHDPAQDDGGGDEAGRGVRGRRWNPGGSRPTISSSD